MQSKFHHVWSRGVKVIFRDRDDFNFFLNHLAVALFTSRIKCLAYSIMSSHFHLIVQTKNEFAIQQLITIISRAYSMHFRKKYLCSIPPLSFEIQYSDENEDFVSMRSKLLYVLRNPVHHYTTDSPLSYEYSSAKYIFLKQILGEGNSMLYMNALQPLSKVSRRELRTVLGDNSLPDTYLYNSIDKSISPLSFLDIPTIQAYWETFKQFMFEMNTLPKDNSDEQIKENILETRTDRFNDLKVCSLIDSYVKEVGECSFLTLSSAQKEILRTKLLNKFITRPQIDRCLW